MIIEHDKVSIIVPVYNSEKYITDTWNSIKDQTYKKWEVIFVDDASLDRSLEILYDIKSRESFYYQNKIKIISLEVNQGVAAARNVGLNNANGQFIAYLDSDDLWKNNKLEIQVNFMKNKECAFSFTGYEFANESAITYGKIVRVPSYLKYTEAIKNTTISTITVMFDLKKIDISLLKMPQDMKREDTATWWNILRNGFVAYGINEPLSIYRRHKNSHSSNKIKAVWGTWCLYRKNEKFNRIKAIQLLCINLYYAILRRI